MLSDNRPASINNPSRSPIWAWSSSGFLYVKRQFSVATVSCFGARPCVCHCNRSSFNQVELNRIGGLDPLPPVLHPVQTQLRLHADVLVIAVIFIRAATEISLPFINLCRVRQNRLIDVASYAGSLALTMGRATRYKQIVWSSFITLPGSTLWISQSRTDVAQRVSVTRASFTVTDWCSRVF